MTRVKERPAYTEEYFLRQSLENRSLLRLLRWRLRWVKQHAPAGGRLLDIGCATGLFLKLAQSGGFHVYGVDVSEHAVEKAGALLGEDRVLRVDVDKESLSHADGSFDVVTLFYLLEHLHAPGALLRQVARVMSPGGLVFLETLNYSSLLRKLFGRQWYGFLPEHFSPQMTGAALRALLKDAGLDAVDLFARVHPSFLGPRDLEGRPKPVQLLWQGMKFPLWRLPYYRVQFRKRLYLGDILSCVARKLD